MGEKIIFWVDGDLLSFVIGYFLQHKYDSDFFAIIDTVEKPRKFFQKQTLVNFKKSWFYNDYVLPKSTYDVDYLNSFEKKYSINLWLLALNERIFYRYNEFYSFNRNEILSILEQECKLFEKIIEECNPDFLIIKTVDLHQNFLFSEICRVKKIKIIMLEISRFGNSILTQKLDTIDYPKPLEQYDDKLTESQLEDFLKNNNRSKILTEYRKHYINSITKRLKAGVTFFLSLNTNTKTHFSYFGRSKLRVFLRYIQYPFIEKYRKSFINRNLAKKIITNFPFVCYPLHEEPERTLLLGSPFYTNQIEIIRHIAKSLPVTHLLLVKEHPSQSVRGWRPISYYKEIMDIPNVILLHPDLSLTELLQTSSLVVSISGTAILEAAFYKKPSILFADTVFSNLSFVEKVITVTDLPDIVTKSLMKQVDLSELSRFVSFYKENIIDFDHLWFQTICNEKFFYGGNLANVDISQDDFKSFLDENKIIFEHLTDEYIKKIYQHKSYSNH